jgi:glycosyltransferase involved in cell wall biosynthesis
MVSSRPRPPERETIDGLDVYHPRYFMIPKIGRVFYGLFFFLSLLNKIKKIYMEFHFDVMYVPWVYPDGVGSQYIARAIKKPIVVAALGSDINVYTKYFLRRKIIVNSLSRAEGVIAVSDALKDTMVRNGVPKDKITVVLNGVNTDLFKPMDKEQCRRTLDILPNEKVILFAGNLVPTKGVVDLLDTFFSLSSRIRDLRLVIVGDGPLKDVLIQKAKNMNVSELVRFAGTQPHDLMSVWMNACDVFCLPSHSEGCPNVVLEAMACGAHVVATKVGGIPELIDSELVGTLVPAGRPPALAAAIENIIKGATAPKKEAFKLQVQSWSDNAVRVFEILESVSLQ